MVSWVAGGHHLKLHRDHPFKTKVTDRVVRTQGIPTEFVFWGSHPDIPDLLKKVCLVLEIPEDVPLITDTVIPLQEEDEPTIQHIESIVEDYINQSKDLAQKMSREEKFCLALAKGIVISSDVAGSALPRKKRSPQSWVQEALLSRLSTPDLEKIILNRLKGGNLRPFQRVIADSKSPVTLTIAGCGTGKTLAAYAWAGQHAAGRKLFFCYPTTGTATAGFEDYLLAQNSLERALIHGRSHVDLERILSSTEGSILEQNQGLESLKAWPQQVIACTVDTVLGLMQNQRRGLFSFPSIACGAFVFDEIHNYDAKLFGALLTFLDTFPHAPALLMSASIPQSRLHRLRNVLGDRLGEPVWGDAAMEELDRYRIKWSKVANCWDGVKETLSEGKKVLWVCNTVRDSIRVYEEAHEQNLPIQPIVYHSRFRYKDRIARQSAVIDQFKRSGPAFIISTQVCEMSLDISSDLMVTALAPLPALIQRLGRLNRHYQPSPEIASQVLGDCLIYEFSCRENKPYGKEDLDKCRKSVNALLERPCSQRNLAEALAEIQQREDVKTYSAWLDGIWESDQRPLREGDESVTVVLERDIREITKTLQRKGLKPSSMSVAAWTIPMWYNAKVQFKGLIGCYPVVGEDVIEYDEERGASWKI